MKELVSYIRSRVEILEGDLCNPELNILQGKYLLLISDKRHEMQKHSTDHGTLKTGRKLTFPGHNHPLIVGCPPFTSEYILAPAGDHRHVAWLSACFSFLKWGDGSCGRTHRPTQVIQIGWVGTEEEGAPPNQPEHLLVNMCHNAGRGKVHTGRMQEKGKKPLHKPTSLSSTH